MKRVLSDCTNSQVLKKNKHSEALQELYNLRPEFNGKPVYFFYRKAQYREGLLIYDKQDRTFYIFDKKTNEKFDTFASWIKFLKIKKIFSGERSALATIFFEPNSSGSNLASLLKTRQTTYWKNYNSTNIAEVTLLIKSFKTSRHEFFDIGIRENVDGISVIFFGREQKIEKYLIIKWQENLISYELNILEKYVKKINGIETGIATERTLSEIEKTICYISVAKICTENRSQPHEAYRRLDCYLLVAEEILSKKVQFQRKNQTIHTLQNRIKQKVEEEGEKVSEELYQIAQDISRKVVKNEIDLSSLNPIFQELIRVQSGKANGVRYHPMFMRWAIAVYSRAGHAAYEAMKDIMRLPSISLIKTYINKSQQHSGWQDKTARHILEKMSIENIGLLWSQRDNYYVGYLDFENEKEELQSFAMQCEKELQTVNNSSLPTNLKDYNRNLATQVYQIVWHSATCNFAYPIAYYGINTLTAYEINKILFHLAANLECIGIYTCRSVCDGAGENRNHIKSFDCKFAVCLLDPSFSNEFQVNRNSLKQPMPTKQNWNINDFCEFKSLKDNKWYTAIITNIDSETQTFIVTILSSKEEWNVVKISQNMYIRPLYDIQTHWTNYKIINPITGTPWF
ncbi:unnamed protein product [Rhizophagus irregularis]|nr:unnamed protein product [Rhizophagus irregularis]